MTYDITSLDNSTERIGSFETFFFLFQYKKPVQRNNMDFFNVEDLKSEKNYSALQILFDFFIIIIVDVILIDIFSYVYIAFKKKVTTRIKILFFCHFYFMCAYFIIKNC